MTDLARRLRLSLALGVLSDARLNRREREALAVLREAVEALLNERHVAAHRYATPPVAPLRNAPRHCASARAATQHHATQNQPTGD